MYRRGLIRSGVVSIGCLITGCSSVNFSPQKTERERSSDTRLHIEGFNCGVVRNNGSVSFNRDDGIIRVKGTIPSEDGKNTLETSTFSNNDGEKTLIEVSVVDGERNESCSGSRISLKYDAAVSFEGYFPATVDLIHISPVSSSVVDTERLDTDTIRE